MSKKKEIKPTNPDTVPVPEVLPPNTRFCNSCGEHLPLEKFVSWGRRHECHECAKVRHREKDKRIAAAKPIKVAEELAAKMVSAVNRESLDDAPHITELVDEIFKQMGGSNKFVGRWLNQVHFLEENDPGSKKLMDAYNSIAKLVALSTKYRDTAPDVALLNDEQLLEQLQQSTSEMISKMITQDGVDPMALLAKLNPDETFDAATKESGQGYREAGENVESVFDESVGERGALEEAPCGEGDEEPGGA